MRYSQTELREKYNYERGSLISKTSGRPIPVTKDGMAVIGGIKMNLRDLVWVYHYGPVPQGKQVVHLNEEADDAYIESLRLGVFEEEYS